jgi:ADP-ribosyl-[dinitrogen reductase] hydrolase
VLSGQIAAVPLAELNSEGYVIDTLEASLWCLLNTHSYAEAVLAAVNLGEDTDTTGAVTGGLAGIYYGYDSIPPDWLREIARRDEIIALAARFEASLATAAPPSLNC